MTNLNKLAIQNKHNLVKKSDFYKESEIEELFVKGISARTPKNGITEDGLKKITKSCISSLGRTSVTNINRSAAEAKGKIFYNWYKASSAGFPAAAKLTVGRTQKLKPGGYFDCDTLVDEWFKWFLTTPRRYNPFSNPEAQGKDGPGLYGHENVFLMQKKNIRAYFTTAASFREPDRKAITIMEKGYLLVPAFNVIASTSMFPSLNTEEKLLIEVISDLFGLKIEEVEAKFDGRTITPYCVIRKEPLKIPGIPTDNVFGIPQERLNKVDSSMDILHAGFWILIDQDALTSGDHLLEWKVESVNYETNAYIVINTLV